MLLNYNRLLVVISNFRERKIGFLEVKPWLIGCGIGYELDYSGDWSNDLDNWLEYIEFCYAEEDWYELGLSLANFIEDAIVNKPKPLKLPQNDRVVMEQFQRSK